MKPNQFLLIMIAVSVLPFIGHAQNTFPSTGNAGIGTTTPFSSSALEIKSTTEGVLIPRMTAAQRNLIPVSALATGLLIYQTNNTPGFYYYSGTAWTPVSSKGANTSLSNLKTTAIDSSLLPATTNSINLGTSTLAWKDVNLYNLKFADASVQTTAFVPYTAGTGINISGTTISSTASSGANLTLSNLTKPTAVNLTLQPGIADSLSLGAKNFRWKNLNVDNVVFADGTTQTTAFVSSGANSSLSNLTATSINQSLIPASNNSLLLGSGSNGWRNIYLDSAVYLNNQKFLFTGSVPGNTFGGLGTGNSNTTGSFNTAFGNAALTNNSSGNNNTGTGAGALYNNTTGYSNVAIGINALHSNVDRSNLVAVGDSALFNNENGATISYAATQNTAVGSKALYTNNTGFSNTATGYNALYSNVSGELNTGNGNGSLFTNSSGNFNTAMGASSLYASTTGSDIVAIGAQSLISNTTGSDNTATGSSSLYSNTLGNNNTAYGYRTLYNNSTGAFNTVGNNNTAIGYQSLFSNYNGVYNTALGSGADVSTALSYSTAIGANSIISASYQVRVGDNTITSIGGYVNWSNISDGRVKQNIKQNVPGLAFINKLTPITYNLNLEAAEKIIQRSAIKDKNGNVIQLSEDQKAAAKAKEQIVYTGFIAQDVETAAKNLNYDFSGVDPAKNSKDLYGLRYAEFVVPLVKGEQELCSQNDSLKSLVNSMQNEIDELKTTVQLLANKNGINLLSNNTSLSSASLEQNIPNPFKGSTTIGYILPTNYSSAQIIIRDNNGNTLKAINVSGNGKGSLNIDASTISSGAYTYSLLIDGRLIDTKQMILAK